ncbi:hypothetical protein EniLVp02_0191 [Vibrio phage EniLVp02]
MTPWQPCIQNRKTSMLFRNLAVTREYYQRFAALNYSEKNAGVASVPVRIDRLMQCHTKNNFTNVCTWENLGLLYPV